MKRTFLIGIVGAAATAATAFAWGPATVTAAKNARAAAVLHDATGNEVGWVKLHEDGRGRVHVNIHVAGLAPGEHGIHVHSVGSCAHTPSANFGGAGTHHNPSGTTHPNHAGDLGNLRVKQNGNGALHAKTTRFSLAPGGAATLFDGDVSAIVIHRDRDDLVEPNTGNSGPRIACGVIVAT